MYKLTLKNAQGNTLEFNQNGQFTIVEIQGLHPPDATINTDELSLIDGAFFNSSKVNMRQIQIAFAIETAAAKNRIEVYKVLKSKQMVEIYYEGDYRNVYITGYVESVNIDYFAKKQIVTTSILCPSPFFKDAQEMVNEIISIIKSFSFPFSITESEPVSLSYIDTMTSVDVENLGDIDTGLIFDIYARGNASNVKVFDYVTGEYIGVNFDFESGDLLTIDTRQGNKSIELLRGGVTTNEFNRLMDGSKWLQLPANGGVYTYESETGKNNLLITIRHTNLYEGV